MVVDELANMRSKDIPYSRVLSSMCTTPHPIAVEAHKMFLETNLGDPGIFCGTAGLEEKLISLLGEILQNRQLSGYICSGGTEANIQAIRAARNIKKGKNIVVPRSAHFSFEKVGDILGLEVRKAELTKEFKVDVSSVEDLVDSQTVSVVGVAGNTEFGQTDPMEELSDIAADKGIPLHVDAAFGGLIIPFMEQKQKPSFDFRLEGVTSMTIDPHKMGMATIPSGGIFFRNENYINALAIETPYLTSVRQITLTGTRPGTGVASAYAVLKHLGRRGMEDIVKRCLNNTSLLVSEMSALGFEPVIEPPMNIVCFETEKCEIIKEELYKKRWVISTISDPRAIRFVIMPHLGEEIIKKFVSDFKIILKGV
ncbi:MAG: tyrosine decarboxylase MfnA [Candidatus Hadarchaeota archaeon]